MMTVHSGIGSARAERGNALGSEFAQRGLQFVLNRLTGGWLCQPWYTWPLYVTPKTMRTALSRHR